MSKFIKGIILAAGRGSRMGQLTSNIPKCFLKIKGKSLISLQLKALRQNNIEEISIVTGYQSEKFLGMSNKIFHNDNWCKTQMVSSLEKANDWLKNFTCIVSYSDIFYSPSAIKSLIDCDDDFALTYDPNWLNLWGKRFKNPLDDAETFEFNKENYLKEIGSKTNDLKKINGQYMGLIKITPRAWFEIIDIRKKMDNSERDNQDMTSLLNIMCKNTLIKVIKYEGIWGEVDHISDLNIYK